MIDYFDAIKPMLDIAISNLDVRSIPLFQTLVSSAWIIVLTEVARRINIE